MTPGALVHAFRRGAWHPSLDTTTLPGDTEMRLALVPEIVIAADRRRWDGAAPGLPAAPTDRRELLLRAVHEFEHGVLHIGGLGPQSGDDFRAALWRTAGIPAALTDRWCAMLRAGLTDRPRPEHDEALALVALPGNTFTCLAAALEQVERSAAVWVRPSRREPLSAARLVAALLQAGWPAERIALYPTDRCVLPGLIRRTDRQVVFGGSALSRTVRSLPDLTLHGPGRGCALVPAQLPLDRAVEWLVPLIAADAGRFCSNVRTVVCAGPAQPLASRLAAALDQLRADDMPLTASREPGAAKRAARSVAERMRPGDQLLTRRPPVVAGPDGAPCVTPHLVLVGDGPEDVARHPLIGHEVPFPFAAVVSAGERNAARIADGSQFVYEPPQPAPRRRTA